MAQTFFFYDLETSGISPRTSRIMQFAGQRTDINLNAIDDPVDLLIKLPPDCLPDPRAILITGITPQKTIEEGLTEAEFLDIFNSEISLPETIFVGFNNIRFDDEFIRFLNYRNLLDPYEWQYKDGRSRFDILDLVRMTRALRPDGIKWPFLEGKPANKLELLSKENGLKHISAHDALSDVGATIEVAKLIKIAQPQLFDYLFNLRNKASVIDFLNKNDIFVYTTSYISSDFLQTSVAAKLMENKTRDALYAFDLRYDPNELLKLKDEDVIRALDYTNKDLDKPKLPILNLKYNQCPAVSPLGTLTDMVQDNICLNIKQVKTNFAAVKNKLPEIVDKLSKALEVLDTKSSKTKKPVVSEINADQLLYDGFIDNQDKQVLAGFKNDPHDIESYKTRLGDERLKNLLLGYKAHNYPDSLSASERKTWQQLVDTKLMGSGIGSLKQYFEIIGQLAGTEKSADKQFILEELKLYGESIMPY